MKARAEKAEGAIRAFNQEIENSTAGSDIWLLAADYSIAAKTLVEAVFPGLWEGWEEPKAPWERRRRSNQKLLAPLEPPGGDEEE